MITGLRLHHCTVSVRDIDNSAAFYAIFGFKSVSRWEAQDNSLTIVHLARGDGFILEMFRYAVNEDLSPVPRAVGNDLMMLGVKHLAFRVPDIEIALGEFREMDAGEVTGIQHGRTGIDYFFIADPDGNWVEVVQDDRDLSPGKPVCTTS